MKAYRVKIEVVGITLEHAKYLASQAARLLPDGWSVASGIGNCESSCEECEIGKPEGEVES